MLINLSNHPHSSWKEEQIAAANCYGSIIDIAFPNIPADWNTARVKKYAEKYSKECMSKIDASTDSSSAIHLAGEPVFCYYVAQRLISSGYMVLTSTTQRNTIEENGKKTSVFQFERYRAYDDTYNHTSPKAEKRKSEASTWIKNLYIELKNEYKQIGTNNKTRLITLKWLFLLEFSLIYFLNDLIKFFSSLPNIVHWFYTPSPISEILNLYISRDDKLSNILAYLCVILIMLSFYKIHKMKLQNGATQQNKDKLNSLTHIAVKLLANAIRPRMINMLFLFVFLIHLSCIGNAAFCLLTTDSFHGFLQYASALSVLICSIFYLILIFPIVPPSPPCFQSVFYSGISPITFNPDLKSGMIEIDRNNLIPLVRGFYVENEKNFIQIKEKDIISILLSNQIKVEKLKEQLPSLEKSINSQRPEKEPYLEELQKNLQHAIKDNELLEDIIAAIIKAMAYFEFRDNPEICNALEKVKFEFSQPLDCDDFDNCFDEAKRMMQNYASQNYEIIINSSPATKVVTSALTLLSIQNDRYLLYFKQYAKQNIKEKMCLTVKNDKSVKDLVEELADELSQDKV